MMLNTKRLTLRPWQESDAESLFAYAKDPEVGPSAGWPPHKSVEESRNVIKNVFTGAECYAICEKGSDTPIGAIELKLNGHTDMTEREDECELGYWLGKPFWGKGYMPEAAVEIIRHGFEDLGMSVIWCGYYDGNQKSKRVQEKVGFIYHHTCNEVEVPLMQEIRVGHTNCMTREQWMQRQKKPMTVNEYQKLAMTTLNRELNTKDILINGVMGLCGEAGEVIDIVKKHLAQGHELDREKLIRELGDVAWYLAETATALDVDLETVFAGNIAKLKKRYPEGFEREKSVNRAEE